MSNSPAQSREKLDFESPEDRQARLGVLLNSISAPNSPSQNPGGIPAPQSRPFAVPESSVLARVRDFLPKMATSTQELLKKMEENPDDVDIENTEGDERVIAMDVNLGVFDVNGQPRGDLGPEVDLPETAAGDDQDDDEDEDEELSSESSSSSSGSDEECDEDEPKRI